jgi:hypothetical protein
MAYHTIRNVSHTCVCHTLARAHTHKDTVSGRTARKERDAAAEAGAGAADGSVVAVEE